MLPKAQQQYSTQKYSSDQWSRDRRVRKGGLATIIHKKHLHKERGGRDSCQLEMLVSIILYVLLCQTKFMDQDSILLDAVHQNQKQVLATQSLLCKVLFIRQALCQQGCHHRKVARVCLLPAQFLLAPANAMQLLNSSSAGPGRARVVKAAAAACRKQGCNSRHFLAASLWWQQPSVTPKALVC